jgi:hypothetical protein
MGLYTDTSKLKWIFWTSHHSVLLIDMLLKSSRNLSTRTNGSLGLQICNNQSMIKMALTNSLLKTSPSHRKRRVTGRQRRTPKNGAISTKSPGTTPMNVAQNKSLVVEIKDKEPNPDSKSDSENTGKRQIIDADPTAIVATTTIQLEEPTDPEEGEHLFHSQMWVKGTPLHFIVDSGSQKNLISAEVIKQLGLSTTPHPQPYNIGWLRQGRDLYVSANSVDCHTTSNPSRMRYYVMFPHWMSVMFSWANHICGSAMLFMSLDPIVSLFLWGVISTEYQR